MRACMKFSCTIAYITHLLGFQPTPGVVYDIYPYQLQGYTNIELAAAVVCARKLKIRYRILK
jgi:hypothetical protein